ncbi:single-stranded-DNA-specific exonuclease RecJ [uncultured Megamonas sp.]|uniref:single-stranded-DNA-specific exonuclease RecJ n=1 Tax=uncultured Megamonas sp. TaxID=286140 RepID=UPI0025949B82|nr:single-stranded-DNA-specific exonuclease RecJ [uncultured Megamonas sp.]
MNKRWEILPIDEKKQILLEKNLHISSSLAEILTRKNLDENSAKLFLNPTKIPYHDPFLLKDMEKACQRLLLALKNKEKICIYGDYDVDGVSSTALLMTVFTKLGFNIDYYLPDRHSEGYGLHIESLQKLIPKYDLLITVDCGITALDEVDYAKDKIDMIITDHHLPREILPDAFAIINPTQTQCSYPNKNLCGVGVAFKLCQGLYQSLNKDIHELENYLDIVALGTIADIVPLVDENRRIVKKGLANIQNLGIKTLIEICHYDENNINTGHIGFGVAPRLNAAGRLTHASIAVELLLATDKQTAHQKALYLDEENKQRQEIVEDIFHEAVKKIEENNLQENKIIIVIGENWHEGVIGIAASRLQEKYYRPIIIIATKDNIGKASCRSIDGLHMKNALTYCEQDLMVYGGHSKAAGFTIDLAKLDDFISHMQTYANEHLTDEDLIPIYQVETVLTPQDITMDFIDELSLLEPFGMGNPKPQFVCQNLLVTKSMKMGKENNHLRFNFAYNNTQYTAIGWHMADVADDINNKYVDILFQPELNHWNDHTYLQFKLSDLRQSKQKISYLEEFPAYDTIGKIYLCLRNQEKKYGQNIFSLKDCQSLLKQIYNLNLSDYSIKQCLIILSEINILTINQDKIKLLSLPNQKIDIKNSPTFAKRFNLQKL